MKISEVKKIITADMTGLSMLNDHLDAIADQTRDALDCIAAMHGRLILTGLGKSGHIGSKLAATFASTGTPAFFLHPAEASHGDLGMVQPEDVILALSWSGETRELADVVGYAKRRSVKLISITSVAESTLAKASDISIILPRVREACPHNLAPTTSTLLQLAMGDALAIALLQEKGLSEEGFHGFHPGGSLGAALKRLDEVMIQGDELPLVEENMSVVGALGVLSAKGKGIVGVTRSGALQGVITDGDIRRYLESHAASTMREALHESPCRKLMTEGSVTFSSDIIAGEALSVLQERRISAAFVVEKNQPIGLVTMLRLLNRGVA